MKQLFSFSKSVKFSRTQNPFYRNSFLEHFIILGGLLSVFLACISEKTLRQLGYSLICRNQKVTSSHFRKLSKFRELQEISRTFVHKTIENLSVQKNFENLCFSEFSINLHSFEIFKPFRDPLLYFIENIFFREHQIFENFLSRYL